MKTKKRSTLGVYLLGSVVAAFAGFSFMWTLQDAVAFDLKDSAENPIPPDSYPMGIDVEVHEDGWSAYTRTILRESTATWVVSVIGLDGAIICRGSGRNTYRPESSGTFYWDIGYLVNDDCPHPLPVGAKGSLMYIFDIPESKRPMVVDFEVEPVQKEVMGQPRPPITRWNGYDQGEPPPEVSKLVPGLPSPFLYVPDTPQD